MWIKILKIGTDMDGIEAKREKYILYEIEFIIPDESIKSSECNRQDFKIVSSF